MTVLYNQINGSKGPYDKNTNTGRAANAGNEVANLIKNGNLWTLKNSDVKYASTYNRFSDLGWDYIADEPNKVRITDSLAYSTEALKGYDQNGDGTVSVSEFNSHYIRKITSQPPNSNIEVSIGMPNPDSFKFGQTVDLNSDGKIDAGELSAWQIYQDGQEGLNYPNSATASRPGSAYVATKVDGTVKTYEADLAERELRRDPNAVKAQLQKIYNDKNIANTQATFKMPPKVIKPPQIPGIKNLMQVIMQLMQLLMRGFGGFGGLGGFGGSSLSGNIGATFPGTW